MAGKAAVPQQPAARTASHRGSQSQQPALLRPLTPGLAAAHDLAVFKSGVDEAGGRHALEVRQHHLAALRGLVVAAGGC